MESIQNLIFDLGELKARARKSIDLGLNWMFKQQQMSKKGKKGYGAFHGAFIWHDAEAIRALLKTYDRKKSPRLLERARMAGDFLCRIQYKNKRNKRLYGLIETIVYTRLKKIAPSDVFEALPGIVELYQCTKEKKYLDCAKLAGDWLIEHATCDRKGAMGQLFDAKKWESINPLPIHDEAGFLLLFQETNDNKYLEVFMDQIEILREKQDLFGQFWNTNHPSQGRAQYWFTYPVLMAYKVFKKSSLLPVIIRSCDRFLRLQQWDGSLSCYINSDGTSDSRYDCIDGAAIAMSAILWIELYKIVEDKRYLNAFLKAVDFIMNNQYTNKIDRKIKNNLSISRYGAFFHTRYLKEGKWEDSVRDLATFYGIMALEELLKI